MKSALFGIGITQAIYYYFYEFTRAGFEAKHAANEALTVLENMITGAIAGSITSVCTNPIWVINTRLLVKDEDKPDEKIGMRQAARHIFEQDGLLGFWRGVIPALILVANPVIQYTVFEKLKSSMEKRQRALGAFDFFILGAGTNQFNAVSKLCATSITYPYIVVKSRMHLKDSKDEKQRYKSIFDGLTKIFRNEGVAGFYKGIESKLVQSVLTAALTFALKEELASSTVWLLTLLRLRAAVPIKVVIT